jgi:hypothetical protein
MESGSVQSRSDIIYSVKEKIPGINPFRKKGDIRLTTNPVSPPAVCAAWHCKTCRKIILDYEDWQIKT